MGDGWRQTLCMPLPGRSEWRSIALSSAPTNVLPLDPTMPIKPPIDNNKLDSIVAEARRNAEQRELGYRERALKMYP